MDYRLRHPNPHFWSSNVLLTSRPPSKYGQAMTSMFEINAPDGTEFLALARGLSEDEKTGAFYAMEAPKSCPMRRLFESGDLSWLEYWTHKSWLIYLEYEFKMDTGGVIQYVSAAALSLECIDELQQLGTTSPYELNLRSLELALIDAHREREAGFSNLDPVVAEREYNDYLQKYGHRIKSLKVA